MKTNEPTITIPLPTLTPDQLAEIFWAMDADQQAKFFNALGVLALATPAPFSREPGSWFTLDLQMYHAATSDYSLPLGRRVMDCIGQQVAGDYVQPFRTEHERKIAAREMEVVP